jgi:CubicO group peptidase (beta-lactamase class C family)
VRRAAARTLVSGLALIALVSGALGAQAGAQRAARTDAWGSVRDTIRAVMARSDVPSVSVAVARGDSILWEESFGWADRERMVRATPNTMYSLASISKPMTATALMTLVERGKVDLDRPANDYLGTGKLTGLAGDARGATVRRVMSHTAGLPLHYQFYYANQPYPVVSNDETIARYGILVTPPGAVYEYSNLGYGIIDHIIARVSGTDYADFMRANVFVPLGLTHTSVGIGPGLEGYAAQRYDSKQRPIPFYDFDHRGASAIYSSAHDLVRFGMYHLGAHLPEQRRILKDETIASMQRAVAPASYGLGWILLEQDGLRVVSHTGGMPGVQTALTLYPAERVAIVVLMNAVADVPRVTREIERVLLPRYAVVRARADSATRARVQAARQPFSPPAELVGSWTGSVRTWDRTMPFTLTIKADGDVHARLEGQPAALVNDVRWQDNTFVGTFAGTIPTSDAARWPHNVLLSLRVHNDTLSGMASALTTTETVYYALSSWASLTKSAAAPNTR